MKNNIPSWLRWIAVIPCAILAGLLSTFPLHWLLTFGIFPHDGEYFLDFVELGNKVNVSGIELFLSPLVIAVFYIWIGSEIAPKKKLLTAMVLGTLYVSMLVYIFLSANGQATFDAKTAGALLGVLLGVLIVWLRTRENRAALISQSPH